MDEIDYRSSEENLEPEDEGGEVQRELDDATYEPHEHIEQSGDYRQAVLGSVNYGRDCDSIATMAGALAGALGSPVPDEWSKRVAEASRLDLWEPARTLTRVTREVFARDVERRRAHEWAFAELGGPGCSD